MDPLNPRILIERTRMIEMIGIAQRPVGLAHTRAVVVGNLFTATKLRTAHMTGRSQKENVCQSYTRKRVARTALIWFLIGCFSVCVKLQRLIAQLEEASPDGLSHKFKPVLILGTTVSIL